MQLLNKSYDSFNMANKSNRSKYLHVYLQSQEKADHRLIQMAAAGEAYQETQSLS